MKRFGKKGLSPVVATVMLVVLAVIVAIIIFLWARSLIGEVPTKFDRPIDEACDTIVVRAEAFQEDGEVYVVNEGNVPIYGFQVNKKGAGEISQTEEKFRGTLSPGETLSENEGIPFPSGTITDDVLVLVPIILGETSDFKEEYTCDSSYGVEVTVV
jgi:flagellin-like protein